MIKQWFSESLKDIQRNLKDDQIFKDGLTEALERTDLVDSAVCFSPNQQVETSKLLLAKPDELRAFFEEALALNTSKAEDIKFDSPCTSRFEDD